MVLKCIIIVNTYQVPNCCSTDDVYLITNNFNNSLTRFVIIHIKTVRQNGSIQMFWNSKNASQLGIKIQVVQTHRIATYFKSFTPEHYINFPNTLQFLQAPPNANRPSVSLVSISKTYVECIICIHSLVTHGSHDLRYWRRYYIIALVLPPQNITFFFRPSSSFGFFSSFVR